MEAMSSMPGTTVTKSPVEAANAVRVRKTKLRRAVDQDDVVVCLNLFKRQGEALCKDGLYATGEGVCGLGFVLREHQTGWHHVELMEVGLLDDVRERNLILISQSIIDCAAFGELELRPKAEKGGQTCLRIEIQDQALGSLARHTVVQDGSLLSFLTIRL